MSDRYQIGNSEVEFEPGSRGRVLRNLLGIRKIRDMEVEALVNAQNALLDVYSTTHRFTADDIRLIHRQWLGGIYAWAGEYRNVNISRGGFLFAAAAQVPRLMDAYDRRELAEETPCSGMTLSRLAKALARTHGGR